MKTQQRPRPLATSDSLTTVVGTCPTAQRLTLRETRPKEWRHVTPRNIEGQQCRSQGAGLMCCKESLAALMHPLFKCRRNALIRKAMHADKPSPAT
jgi:hypothetical protein